VNITANIIVNSNPFKVSLLLPLIKEWCAKVTTIPDDNKITVFNKGNSKGFIACIPKGGHSVPISTSGLIAL
jgi:hypothetical protein